MVGTEDLDQLVSIALYTGWIEHEKPVSLMLIAVPECGKSALLMQYDKNNDVVTMSDFTAYGFLTKYQSQLESGKVKHLIIPDFINPISRGQDTVKTLIAFLNGLIEEGVSQIQTFAQQVTIKEGAHNGCGLITAITPGELADKQHGWSRMGFMSRLIPICYGYTTQTRMKIHESIAAQEYHTDGHIMIKAPCNPVDVGLDKSLSQRLIPFAMDLSTKLTKKEDDKLYGFRKQKQMQVLVKGCALSEGRDYVIERDIDHIVGLSEYIGTSPGTYSDIRIIGLVSVWENKG